MQKATPIKLKFVCQAVIAMFLWLSGFGCALCCATGLTKSCCLDKTKAGIQSETKNDCAESGCCKQAKRKISSPRAETALQSASEIGCRLLPNQTPSLIGAQRATDAAFQEAPTDASLAVFYSLRPSRFVEPPSPLNRGATYLDCCALLI
jgi:hypothetical protein